MYSLFFRLIIKVLTFNELGTELFRIWRKRLNLWWFGFWRYICRFRLCRNMRGFRLRWNIRLYWLWRYMSWFRLRRYFRGFNTCRIDIFILAPFWSWIFMIFLVTFHKCQMSNLSWKILKIIFIFTHWYCVNLPIN